MKITLFGGGEAEKGDPSDLFKLFRSEIEFYAPSQLLWVPFARKRYQDLVGYMWHKDWFRDEISSYKQCEYLDATKPEDLAKAKNPLIFLSGSVEKMNLLQTILDNEDLLELIVSANYIIGDSGGAMVLGEQCRTASKWSTLTNSLNLIKDTIIEPHYHLQKREELLKDELKRSGLSFALGIDLYSGIRLDASKPITEGILLGEKKVEIIKAN